MPISKCDGCRWTGNPKVCAECNKPAPVQPAAAKLKKARGRTNHVRGKMNSTEQAYSYHLDDLKKTGDILEYWFEGITLKLGPDCRYTPDFLVQKIDGTLEVHDTKGSKKKTKKDGTDYRVALTEDDSKVKMSVTAGMFPFAVFTAYKTPDGWKVEEVG